MVRIADVFAKPLESHRSQRGSLSTLFKQDPMAGSLQHWTFQSPFPLSMRFLLAIVTAAAIHWQLALATDSESFDLYAGTNVQDSHANDPAAKLDYTLSGGQP
jgi:hypothetical protein